MQIASSTSTDSTTKAPESKIPSSSILPPDLEAEVRDLSVIPPFASSSDIVYLLQLTRVRAHRAHIVADYTQVAKSTRRALHELDLATIDLHMAEERRKVADVHLEKAKAGVLGIDHVKAKPEAAVKT